jgi:NOL1/NOP2/fmu family ribosome biogenesis protein
MDIIYGTAKKEIVKKLEDQYGIKDVPYLLIQFGKEKIRAYSGEFSTEELKFLEKNIRIESLGLYLLNKKDEFRLTFDGVSLFKDQITKNIIELNSDQAKQWLSGNDLLIKENRGFVILRYEGELIGCGKSTGERITNFVPKERRIRG